MGQPDNTLIIFIEGDNGGTAQSGPRPAENEIGEMANRLDQTDAEFAARLDLYGGPETYGVYSVGRGFAMISPFPYFKHVPSHLGATRNGDASGPAIVARSFTVSTSITPKRADTTGVVFAGGSHLGGWAFHLQDTGVPVSCECGPGEFPGDIDYMRVTLEPLKAACTGIALSVGLAASLAAANTVKAEPNDGAISCKTAQTSARPNILVWMLDDVGFAQLSAFGGLVSTPNIDRIASRGVRYSNYHTTPICSSSRAAFVTGRNAHTVNMGGHNAFARELPGYNGRIPAGAGTLAENLRQAGYATFALDKWDHLPIAESSPSGPFTYWPQGQGFDQFHGFMSSETDNFAPHLWRGNTIVNPGREAYHLNDDLAAEAIAMLRSRDGAARPAPFFLSGPPARRMPRIMPRRHGSIATRASSMRAGTRPVRRS